MADHTAREAMTPGRMLRNVASNYLGRLVTLGVGFFLTPFILSRLGAGTYGLWVLVGSVLGYVSLLDFGIGGAVIKYVAEHRARGEMEQAHHLVATALRIYTVLGMLAFLAAVALAPIFPTLFNIPPEQRSTASALVVLTGLSVGLSIPCTTSAAVLRGLQRYEMLNLVSGVAVVISALATVVILLTGGSVLGMVAIGIPVMLLMQVPYVWFIHRIAPELRFGWRGARRDLVRKVASYSATVFIVNVTGQVQTQTDEIVIGAFLPISAVTPYAIARRLSDLCRVLTDQFMKVLLPLASELNAGDDRSRLRALYVTSTRLTLAILFPIGLTLGALAGPILSAWVGPAYAAYAPLVVILTVASVIDTSQWPAGSVLQGMARHHPLAVMSVVAAVANLGLSLALVQSIGVTGVALGTLIPTTVVCLGLILPYALRAVGVGAGQALREMLLPALVPLLPAALVLLVLRELTGAASWPVLIGISGTGFVIYAAVYLVAGASRAERDAYRQVTRNILQRLPGYSRVSRAGEA